MLERMRRYPSSLLVQECGFYQLAAEFNKGHGVPRSSLGQDVAVVVSRAMEAFSQVRIPFFSFFLSIRPFQSGGS